MSRMMCQIRGFAISILHLPSYSCIEDEITTHALTGCLVFIHKNNFDDPNMYYMKTIMPKNVAIHHGSGFQQLYFGVALLLPNLKSYCTHILMFVLHRNSNVGN